MFWRSAGGPYANRCDMGLPESSCRSIVPVAGFFTVIYYLTSGTVVFEKIHRSLHLYKIAALCANRATITLD